MIFSLTQCPLEKTNISQLNGFLGKSGNACILKMKKYILFTCCWNFFGNSVQSSEGIIVNREYCLDRFLFIYFITMTTPFLLFIFYSNVLCFKNIWQQTVHVSTLYIMCFIVNPSWLYFMTPKTYMFTLSHCKVYLTTLQWICYNVIQFLGCIS